MTDHDDRRVCPVTGEPLLDGEYLSRGLAAASCPGNAVLRRVVG